MVAAAKLRRLASLEKIARQTLDKTAEESYEAYELAISRMDSARDIEVGPHATVVSDNAVSKEEVQQLVSELEQERRECVQKAGEIKEESAEYFLDKAYNKFHEFALRFERSEKVKEKASA